MSSFIAKLRGAQAALVDDADPWKRVLERSLRTNVSSISTIALTDLLGVAPTTGNCRRLALSMRALGWIPLKSRNLMPGGWRTTACRGWTRPTRESKSSFKTTRPGAAGLNHDRVLP